MEKFQEAREKALKALRTADHMISVTYGVVKDAKLLLAILDNLNTALQETMNSIIFYDRLFKRIPPFQDSFESRYNIFRLKSARRYSLDSEYITTIAEVKEMLDEHKKSPVEFVRNDKFVICNNSYRMKTLSIIDIKKYIARAKIFIQEANIITSKNEELFK
ncbi:hypothetical protein KY345_02075 [Candidatus Woesearchaeota archaeon]|nr:hypothetical protein [Candidatus Woesearchaeota archaeon]